MTNGQAPGWPPDMVDLAGLAYMLSTSPKQVQRLLSAGRLPGPDANVSITGGIKGRRWLRDKVVGHICAGRQVAP